MTKTGQLNSNEGELEKFSCPRIGMSTGATMRQCPTGANKDKIHDLFYSRVLLITYMSKNQNTVCHI